MKIGSRIHDIKRNNTLELVEACKSYGYDSCQLVLKKAIKEIDFTKVELNDENVNEISKYFNSLNVAMMGAYFNPVHSNKEKVKNDISYFKKCLDYCQKFGTKYVGTETGSYNDEPWIYHPKNQTEEGYQESKKVIESLVRYAETKGSIMLVEGAYNHVMYKPEVLKRLYDEINSDNLKIIVDVYNYLYIGNYKDALSIFNTCIELFKDNIKIWHIKDFDVVDNKLVQVQIGKGLMPLDKMIPIIKEKCPDSVLIFEGSKEEDLSFSIPYIKNLLGE